MDNPRPITVTEQSFFSAVGTGKGQQKLLKIALSSVITIIFNTVPVVAVFTKLDALDTKEWMKLKNGMTHQET